MRFLKLGAISTFFAGIISLIQGCSLEDAVKAVLVLFALSLPGGSNTSNVVIPTTTKVADESTVQSLTSFSQDTGEMHFSETTDVLTSLKVGDALVFGVSDKTPYGLLRKITGIQKNGDLVALQTTQGTISDAIEQGTLNVSWSPSLQDVSHAQVSSIPGVNVKPNAALIDKDIITLSLNTVLFDLDGNYSTTNDQVKALGSIGLNLKVDLSIEVSLFSVKKISFTDQVTQNANLKIEASFSASREGNKRISRIVFPPLQISILTFTPILEVYVGFDGQVTLEMTTGIEEQASFNVGVIYENGNWRPEKSFNIYYNYQKPSFSARANLRGYVKPQINIMLWGVAGPYGNIEGFLEFSADLSSSPAWTLYGGLSVRLGVKVGLFGLNYDYESPELAGLRKLIAQGDIPPFPPSNLLATPLSSSQIRLSWNDTSSNETGFKIYRGGGLLTTVGAGVTSYTNSGLSASTPYCYQVAAYNSAGESAKTSQSCATTQAPPVQIPTAPSGLSANATSSSSISLSWSDNSNNETGFRIYRGGSLLTTVGAGITSYINSGLTASTQYCYQVAAYNSAGESAKTSQVCAITQAPPVQIPTAPSNLNANATSSTSITLNWSDNSNNETEFRIYRGGSLLTTVGAGVTSFTNSGLTASTQYCYQVAAYNSAGESNKTSQVCAITQAPPVQIPTAPSNLSANATSSTSITLNWSDNSNNETNFKIYRSGSLLATVGAGVTSYTNSGLTASTQYCYQVAAYNSAGESSKSSQACATTQALPVQIPTAPSNLSANATSSTSIVLNWSDNSNNETEFRIYRGGSLLTTVGAGVTSYTNSSLNASTQYCYQVAAYNSAGESAKTSQACATTQAPPVQIPTAPSNPSANATSSSSIALSWSDNSNNETGFRIYRGGSLLTTVGAGITSYTNSGLTASTQYCYQMSAYNSAGESSKTSQVCATTSSPANQPPTADAGANQTVTDTNNDNSEVITLDGSGSSDPDGTIISYVWTWTDGAGNHTVSVSTPTTSTALSQGTHTVTLTIEDNDGTTDSDTVVITVSAPQPSSYNVTVNKAGTGDGTISFQPNGTICGANCRTYTQGTQVTITATPNSGSIFAGWPPVGCDSVNGNQCTVTVNGAITTTATFDLQGGGLPGLVAEWTFDEGSGTTASDTSGNGHNGTLLNGASYATGVSSSALSLDGVNDYISVPDHNDLDLTVFTIEGWFQYISIRPATTGNQGIVSKYRHDTPSEGGYQVFIGEGDGNLEADIKDSLNNRNGGVATASAGVWQHFALTFDGTTAKMYLNGLLVDSNVSAVSVTPNSLPLLIGALRDLSSSVYRFFGGVLDEIRIYNTVLSSTEVLSRCELNNPPGVTCGSQSYSVNVSKAGTGDGTISFSPAGTSCGVNCRTFTAGAQVTITANSSQGSVFASWSPASCSSVNGNQCSLTVNGNISITATFNIQQTGTLISEWKFDEGSGITASDSTANGHEGTLKNGPSYVAGISGTALQFDGVDDYVEVPHSSGLNIGPTDDWTVEYWIKYTGGNVFITKTDYINDNGWGVGYLGGSQVRFQTRENGIINSYDSGMLNIADGAWHHEVVIFDRGANEVRFYEDAMLIRSIALSITGNLSNTEVLSIGGSIFGVVEFNGLMDEVRLYKAALSSQDVLDRCNLTKPAGFTCGQAPTAHLTVNKAGTGTGTISSNPGGISCGTDCDEYYAQQSIVTLTPSASVGSQFAGWSGDADCSDGQVTMTADHSCTATFDLTPVLATYQIAYQCSLTIGSKDICVINSDSTGFRQLTTNPADDTVPSMNNSGLIAYGCHDGNDQEICVIRSDGTGFRQVTNNSLYDNGPSINAAGRIAYTCKQSDGNQEICVIDFDGTNFRKLTTSGNDDFSPSINDLDQIAYVCYMSGRPEICAVNADGTGYKQLTNIGGTYVPGGSGEPSLNNAGKVAFLCRDYNLIGNICVINLDLSGFDYLTDGFTNGGNMEPSINASGRVAFACQGSGPLYFNVQACAINSDRTGFIQLTSGPSSIQHASINDEGIIAYELTGPSGTSKLCVIKDDGTGFVQITDSTYADSSYPSISD